MAATPLKPLKEPIVGVLLFGKISSRGGFRKQTTVVHLQIGTYTYHACVFEWTSLCSSMSMWSTYQIYIWILQQRIQDVVSSIPRVQLLIWGIGFIRVLVHQKSYFLSLRSFFQLRRSKRYWQCLCSSTTIPNLLCSKWRWYWWLVAMSSDIPHSHPLVKACFVQISAY